MRLAARLPHHRRQLLLPQRLQPHSPFGEADAGQSTCRSQSTGQAPRCQRRAPIQRLYSSCRPCPRNSWSIIRYADQVVGNRGPFRGQSLSPQAAACSFGVRRISAQVMENYPLTARARVAEMTSAAEAEPARAVTFQGRSEEHTSELQSLMRISYAGFCLKKKKNQKNKETH